MLIKQLEAMYILLSTSLSIIISSFLSSSRMQLTLSAKTVAVSAVTWHAILKQFTKNKIYSRILPQNAGIAGKPIILL